MLETSTYGRDFMGQHAQRRASYAPKHARAPDIKFAGESSYRTAFDAKAIPKRHMREKEKAMPSAPFDGTSTHRADFVSHKIGPREAQRQREQWQKRDDDRAWETEQRAQFYKKPPAGTQRCPAANLVSEPTRRSAGHSIFKQQPTGQWESCSKGLRPLGADNNLTGYAVKGTYEGHLPNGSTDAPRGATPRFTPT